MTQTISTITIDRQPLADSFDQWRVDQREFDEEVRESLAALEAFQSHLDQWQRQLAAEREELNGKQEQIVKERAELESDRGNMTCDLDQLQKYRDQLDEARDKIDKLRSDLLTKSDELRTIDQQRAEMSTQLEVLRAREQSLHESLERERQHHESQQAQWNTEIKHMHELLERQAIVTKEGRPRDASKDPVIGSIVAQFDKLRQQQAEGRKARQKK